jgi:hypothetical protein
MARVLFQVNGYFLLGWFDIWQDEAVLCANGRFRILAKCTAGWFQHFRPMVPFKSSSMA